MHTDRHSVTENRASRVMVPRARAPLHAWIVGTETEYQAADVRAPAGAAPTGPDRLNGTGTTEDHNTTVLTGGEMATLVVGENPVRVTFSGETGASAQVATTDLRLPGGFRLDWVVTTGVDDVVYVEAADENSTYELWVWTSSGPRG